MMLPEMSAHTGFSTGVISWNLTFAYAASFIVSVFLFKPRLAKFGAKKLLIFGDLLLIGHYLLYSYAESLWMLRICGTLGGLVTLFACATPVSVVITNWFVDKRSSVLAVIMGGYGFGGMIIMPVIGRADSRLRLPGGLPRALRHRPHPAARDHHLHPRHAGADGRQALRLGKGPADTGRARGQKGAQRRQGRHNPGRRAQDQELLAALDRPGHLVLPRRCVPLLQRRLLQGPRRPRHRYILRLGCGALRLHCRRACCSWAS